MRENALSDKRGAPARPRAYVPAMVGPSPPEPHAGQPRKPSPPAFAGSAELDAMIARVGPAILELLADGIPRAKPAIVAALAGRHDRQDVISTLMRLSVTGELEQAGSKYTRAAPGGGGPPQAA